MDKLDVSSFRVEIKDYLSKIEKAISDELGNYRDSVFFSPLTYATRGGGRIRPIMLVLACESVGGKGLNPLPAAIAVELAHTESLIHDDIIDKDNLRRGTAAFHALYGWGLSALSADFILSMILDIAARYSDARVTRTLAFGARRMCEGELEELEVQNVEDTLSLHEFIGIVEKKTASLFEVSAKLGALIGGGSDEEVAVLSEYGRLVGTAYQIQDDILDWENSSLVKMVQVPGSGLGKANTVEYLEQMSRSCVAEAKTRLEKLGLSKARSLLGKLADYVVLSNSHSPNANVKLSSSER